MSKFDVDQGIRDLEKQASRQHGSLNTCGFIAKVEEPKGICLMRRSPASPASCPACCSPRSGGVGEKRTLPVFYGTAGDAYVIIGSKGGADTQPGWYLNLRANPVVEVQVGRSSSPRTPVWRPAKSANNSGSRWCRWLHPIATTRRRRSGRFQ